MVYRRHRGEVADDQRVSSPAQVLRPATALQQRTPAVLSYVVFFGGILTIALALYLVVVCYTSLPWSDGWIQINVAAAGDNPFSLHWLWQQHNEHRLLIPKLLLAIDLRFFGAQQKFLLAMIFGVQLLHCAVLSWSMRVLGGWGGSLWRTGTGLAAFCLFCPAQWENLVWGFQSCFVLPPLFATVSLVALLLYWKASGEAQGRGARKFIALSVVAALAAMGSLANGVLLLPLLTIAAMALQLRRSVVLTYIVGAVAGIALYLHNYSQPSSHHPLTALLSPGKLIAYVGTYFGSSWTSGGGWKPHNLFFALYLGLLGLLLLLIFLFRLRQFVKQREAFPIQLLLIALFSVATAALTALGRIHLGSVQAFASRYQTVALLFWFSLGCLLLAAAAASTKPLASTALQIFFVAVLLRGAFLAFVPLRDGKEHAFRMRAASAALITGVNDPRQLDYAFVSPYVPPADLAYLKQHRLSIFSGDPQALLGEPLSSTFSIAPRERCDAAIESVAPLSSTDWRITGWVWDVQRRVVPAQIVTVANGIIAGLGAAGDWQPDLRAARGQLNTSLAGFTAYAANLPASEPLSAYAVLRVKPGEACYLGTITPK